MMPSLASSPASSWMKGFPALPNHSTVSPDVLISPRNWSKISRLQTLPMITPFGGWLLGGGKPKGANHRRLLAGGIIQTGKAYFSSKPERSASEMANRIAERSNNIFING